MKKNILSLTASATFLVACGTAGTNINAEGVSNGNLKWPTPETAIFDHKKGTFPNLANLAAIKPNMTRDQLYDLIGRPHYTEGFHVREWTYLFHFRTPGKGTNGVSTCQYKILFDKNHMAQSYYWKAIDPAEGVKGICGGKKPQIYTLNADALFAFDKSNLSSISPKGKAELVNLVSELKKFTKLNKVTVSGHTDRLGSDSYNLGLSKRRAATVGKYLTNNGVNTNIVTKGFGESQPVVKCNDSNRQALIKCLAPNRRVDVMVDGYGMKK